MIWNLHSEVWSQSISFIFKKPSYFKYLLEWFRAFMTTSIIQSCLHLHFECSFYVFGPKITAYTLKPCLYAYCKKLVTPLIWVCTLIHISSVSRHLPMLARDFNSQSGINFQAFLPHSVIAENCQNAFFFNGDDQHQ